MAFDTLSSRMSRGSLRSQFTRLQQCLSLWSLEKLPDVYLLKFHSPAIGAGEVKALLRVRADFNPLGVDGVMLDRLQCVKELRKP